MNKKKLIILAASIGAHTVAQSAIIVSDDVDGNGDVTATIGTITTGWAGWGGTLPVGATTVGVLAPLADDVDAGFADSALTRTDNVVPTPFFNGGATATVTYGGTIAEGTYVINLQVIDYNNASFATPSIAFAGLTATSSTTTTPASGDDEIWTFTYNVGAGNAAIGNNLDLALTAGGGAAGNAGIDHVEIDFVPVPEPSSVALLGLGGLALILRRRK